MVTYLSLFYGTLFTVPSSMGGVLRGATPRSRVGQLPPPLRRGYTEFASPYVPAIQQRAISGPTARPAWNAETKAAAPVLTPLLHNYYLAERARSVVLTADANDIVPSLPSWRSRTMWATLWRRKAAS